MIAGAAMALSSAFVVTNSLRMRRFRPDPGNFRDASADLQISKAISEAGYELVH